ncbi:MAG: hypothetical protein WED10_13350 [Brumimicrobium sp.]
MNILEVNYSNTYFAKVDTNINVIFALKKIIHSINYTLKQVIKDLFFVSKNKSFNDKVICFTNSVNQKNALAPLKDKIDNVIYVGLSKESENRIPMGFGCIISMMLFPIFCYEVVIYKDNRSKILHFFNSYFFIRGMYIWWVIYLKIKKPRALIMSNDHLVWHRTLRMAAQKNSLPVIYIQHASVTEKFPNLEFDLSLLEGSDALNKYSKKKIKGDVSLIGLMKYDKFHSFINEKKVINNVGICTNLLDSNESIYNLIRSLHQEIAQFNIIVRPHPRDKREKLYENIVKEFKCHISDSNHESSFEFLSQVDVNIACETSIHLEAVLLNVYPIYFQLGEEKIDHYGYITNNLIIDEFKSVSDLKDKLNELKLNRPGVRKRAKYYVDTVGTEYDGRSVEKALIELQNYLV